MAHRFAKVSEEEIKTTLFYPSDLVNTKTTIPLRVGEERWIYTSTLRVSVYIHHYSPPLRGIVVYYPRFRKALAFLHQGLTNCGFRKLVRFNLCNIYYFFTLFHICIFLFYYSNLYCITFRFPPTKENPLVLTASMPYHVTKSFYLNCNVPVSESDSL